MLVPKKIHLSLLLFFLLSFAKSQSLQKNESFQDLPKKVGYVNDFSDILTFKQEKELSKIIQDFDQKTTNQFAVVTIDSIKPYGSIKDFATDLGNYWGIGQKDKNNGVIIVVCKNLRKVWVGTGLGAERVLTNDICKAVIDIHMIPHFQNGQYFDGIRQGIQELIKQWK